MFCLHIPTVREETEELLDSREELCSTYVVSREGRLLWEREDDGDTDDADFFFYVHGSEHRESMSIIVQQVATIYSLLYRVIHKPLRDF